MEIGQVFDGTVVKITSFGAFVRLSNGETGLVHISQIADCFVKDVRDFLSEGQQVKVKIVGFSELGKPNLSIKQAREDHPKAQFHPRSQAKSEALNPRDSFEEKLSRFLKESDEKQEELRRNLENKRR
ncbi:MAG: S1 RNA-binding domain-containing protein [Caldiserica bacterium]|nr:S1 RNA-binding domain-containing protein [Caldisericota bacterium]MDH7562675.1 S1 RNA-binding domain-containing protein [Caldisericota bacterium]